MTNYLIPPESIYPQVRGTCPAQYKKYKKNKTYNNRDSLVVTHPTTNRSIWGLIKAERTGYHVFLSLWSYVKVSDLFGPYIGQDGNSGTRLINYCSAHVIMSVWTPPHRWQLFFCEQSQATYFCRMNSRLARFFFKYRRLVPVIRWELGIKIYG